MLTFFVFLILCVLLFGAATVLGVFRWMLAVVVLGLVGWLMWGWISEIEAWLLQNPEYWWAVPLFLMFVVAVIRADRWLARFDVSRHTDELHQQRRRANQYPTDQ